MAKRNAEVVLRYSTIYPFRLHGKSMLCVFCHDFIEEPTEFRRHMDENHQKFTVETAFAHCGKGKEYLKVDCFNMKCRICAAPFKSLDNIAKHIHDVHERNGLDLNYDIGLQPYFLEKERWICFLCHLKLPSLTKLCRHTTSHYQKYTCDVCGRSYLTNEALKYHIRCSHTGNNLCRKCWQDFPTLEKKREHLRSSDSCKPFCCVICGDRFLSWECKQKHVVEMHGEPLRTYDCPDCGAKFNSRKRFYKHYKLNHTDDSFICSCCGLKFGTKAQLEDHRIGHTGEKHFLCDICMKTFPRQKSLKQHMWIHSDTKRFPCLICDKQFAQKVSLKGHMKVRHPDVDIVL